MYVYARLPQRKAGHLRILDVLVAWNLHGLESSFTPLFELLHFSPLISILEGNFVVSSTNLVEDRESAIEL